MRGAFAALLASASLALAGIGVMAATPPPASAAAADPQLLPDVVMRPLTEIRIQKRQGLKRLRFASIIGNAGTGVVELRPDSPGNSASNDCDRDGDPLNDRKAFQRIFGDSDGDGVFTRGIDTVLDRRFAGCSFFHVAHDHWHFEEFARYRLERPKSGLAVASSEKVSFCVRDSLAFAPALPGSPLVSHYGNLLPADRGRPLGPARRVGRCEQRPCDPAPHQGQGGPQPRNRMLTPVTPPGPGRVRSAP
jgi:hypothetical protein